MLKLITHSASVITLLLLIACATCPDQYFDDAYKTGTPASASSSGPAKPSTSASVVATKVTSAVVTMTGNDIDVKETPAAAASTVVVTVTGNDIDVKATPATGAENKPVTKAFTCPDTPDTTQSVSSNTSASSTSGTSNTPSFQPCEARVIKAAIDYCVSNVMKQDGFFGTLQNVGGATAILLSAIAGGIASAAGAGTTKSIGIGAAIGLLSTADSSGLKLLPSSPTASISGMITAAQQYLIAAQPSYKTTPQQTDDEKRDYYKGLFNAVGTACPASSFRRLPTRFDNNRKCNCPSTTH